MKTLAALFFFYVLSASIGLCCEMNNPHRHVNPDGSQGGLINNDAKVESTVYVAFNSRVCDRAWLDGNSKVLDQAIVKENAWIRSNAIVKDQAVVSGEAVVWGATHSPAVVGGQSKVFGNARILAGTQVNGRAEVYGRVTLEDSIVSGIAKVCLGTYLTNENIVSDYFCNPTSLLSKASLKIINLQEDQFNSIPNQIIFESGANFYSDARFFEIKVNDKTVDTNSISISRNRITILNNDLLKDGHNTITFNGRDYLSKIIEQAFEIVVGTSTKSIGLNGPDISDSKIEISAVIDGTSYKVPGVIYNSNLLIKNLPTLPEPVTLALKIVSQKGFIVEEISSSNLPENLAVSLFPYFRDNNTDLQTSLATWNISHPSNVEVINGGINISFADSETVELAKTFQLSSQKASVTFELQPVESLSLFDNQLEIEIIFVSETTKNAKIQTIKMSDLAAFLSGERGLRFSYSKPTVGNDKVTALFRLRSTTPGLQLSQELRLTNNKLTPVDVAFTPMSMTVLNRKEVATDDPALNALIFARDISYPLDSADCSSDRFDVSNQYVYKPSIEEIKFLSVGQTPSMPLYKENRIYGDLSFTNLKRLDIKELTLIIQQYEEGNPRPRTVRRALSPCILERFNNPQTTPPESKVAFKPELDLSKPLFSIPSSTLSNFNSGNGQIAIMFVEAEVYVRTGPGEDDISTEKIESNANVLTILKSPWGDSSFTYGEVEDYDSASPDILRTGGDKWIMPAYSDMLMEIMNNAPTTRVKWRFGDLAKSNGGMFLDHRSTHRDGLDADIKFLPEDIEGIGKLEYDYTKLGNNDAKWTIFLEEFENFLASFQDKFQYIKDIYVELTPNSRKYLNARFANRCYLDKRFIRFDSGKGGKSLLRDVPPAHWHHMHLRFNEVDKDGNSVDYPLTDKPTEDLSSFFFELGPDGNGLKVTPRFPTNFKKHLVWRFQSESGYANFGMNLELGPQGISQGASKQIFEKSSLAVKKHISVTVASKESGACVQHDIEIDPSKAQRLRMWTYTKQGNNFVMVPVSKKGLQ